MKRDHRTIITITLLAALALPQLARAQYELPAGVVSNGGGTATSTSYILSGTVGQPAVSDPVSSTNNNHEPGFWPAAQALTVPQVLLATTAAPTNVSATYTTLNGTVNPNGTSTAVTFEYGPTAGYGSIIAANQSPVDGTVDVAVSATIAALAPNTTYHYRVVASNNRGTAYGADQAFTTLAAPAGLLANGSFEGDMPNYFSIGGSSATATVVWATDQSRTGGHSLKIVKPDVGGDAFWQSQDLFRYWAVGASENADLEVGAWIKLEGVNINPADDTEEIQLIFTFHDSTGADQYGGPLTLAVPQTTASTGWMEVKTLPLSFTYRPDSVTVQFRFGGNATGTAWVDDIFIRSTTPGEWVGSFFNPNVDVPYGWYAVWPNFSNGLANWEGSDSAFAGQTTAEAHSGNASVKLVKPYSGYMIMAVSDAQSFSNDGRGLEFSVWLKTDLPSGMAATANGDPTAAIGFRVNWHDETTGADGYREVGPPSDFRFTLAGDVTGWTEYTFRAVPPAGAVQFNVEPRYWDGFMGTTYWDDFYVDYYTISAADSLALVALYNGTGGSGWYNAWDLENTAVATWYGVTVAGGRVTGLDLNNNNLSGPIPTEIGNLTGLTYLSLTDNPLTGSIPVEISYLTNLTDLLLYSNQLTGDIPPAIGNLTSLTRLNLYNNQLTGSIPDTIQYLTALTRLDLDNNQFTGPIPTWIGSLTNLERLFLGGNPFSGYIPDEVGNLPNLVGLGVNSFQLLPGATRPDWANLDNLTWFYLYGRRASDVIPDWVGTLTQLTGFYLWDHQLSGGIPPWVSNFTSLTWLWICRNEFGAPIPAWIGGLTGLEYLYIYDNQLSGAVPAGVANLSQLRYLYLHNNQLDDLPDLSSGSLSSLQRLRVQSNRFTFEDIVPNVGLASEEYIYAPQDSVGAEQDTTVEAGASLTLNVPVGGLANQYQWMKDGADIAGATNDSYIIASMSLPDTGSYVLRTTNTIATELTLYSRPMHVTADLDTEKPHITDVTKFTEAVEVGSDITVNAIVTEDREMGKVWLHHSQDGGNSFTANEMLPTGAQADQYGITLQSGMTLKGLVYFVRGVDAAQNADTSATQFVDVRFNAADLATDIAGSAFAGGFPEDRWRLISIPANLANNAVSANIGDELGESSDTTWKIYAYTNNPTDPWGEATSFVPGTCYWLYQRVGRDVQFNIGAGTSNSLKSFSITLNPGWNLIGNPYPFKSPIALDPQTYYGPITFTGSDTALTGWTGIVNNLAPWGGYAVYNRTAANQTLVFNALPREGTGKQLAKETGESIEGWLLQLKAVGETYADVANAIGRLEGATEQLDYFDNPEPPYIDGFVSLAMERDDWGANLPRFTSDIRSIGENDGVWDLDLFVKGEKDPITLSHYLQGDLPPGNRIILLDVMTREVHDLLADDRPLTLTGYREDFPYHLKVVAGSASYVEYTTKEILASLPSDFSLAQNYPNPFNPVTHLRYSLFQPARVTLKIYNLLGQEVVTLVDGWQDLGHYEVIWEGRDRFGAQAASGIYFAAYMAEGRLFTRKMVLMK